MTELGRIIRGFGEVSIATAILGSSLIGLAYLSSLPQKQQYAESISKEEITNRYFDWNIHNVQGKEVLVTPHNDGVYGPVLYTKGTGDVAGDSVINSANEIISYKNEFSKQAGYDKEIYFRCNVEDTNKDSHADRISWPRMGDKMPVYNAPFMMDVQEKADKCLLLEKSVQDYLKTKY